MSRYIVAITRWGAPLEQELSPLAALLGLVPYDAKLRLAGPLPVVAARPEGAERARQLLATLRARGHGAVACDAGAILGAHNTVSPRRFELAADALHGMSSEGRRTMLPYGHILALLPARMSRSARVTVTDKEKKLSLGRAAASIAIAPVFKPYKTVEKQTVKQVSDVERVLYVIRRSGSDHVLLGESSLRYEGLGSGVGRTSQESFAVLTAELRRRAPGAAWDERLLARKKNDPGELDLAAHLTAVGLLASQL